MNFYKYTAISLTCNNFMKYKGVEARISLFARAI